MKAIFDVIARNGRMSQVVLMVNLPENRKKLEKCISKILFSIILLKNFFDSKVIRYDAQKIHFTMF